jgi:peptidoglycan/xylan/chitin deacetylase (PgdA/CDA1 family)
MGSHVGAPCRIAVVVTVAALAAACGGTGTQRQADRPPSAPAGSSAPIPPPVVDAGTAPLPRPVAPTGPRHGPVAILMYHLVAAAPRGAAYPELWVGPGRFGQQMKALAHAGYHGTTLDAVWRAWHGHGSLPRHPLVISFDDGYQSQSTVARRMLARLGWPGVLNLEVDNVGLKGGLSRSEVRAMVRDGWEIDAHTLTHPDLTTLDAAQLRREVAGSRRWLRRVFGVPVRFFAYPAGRYDPAVEAAVRAAGYRGATTTQEGQAARADDPYAMPRVRVLPEVTASQLVALVRGLGRG